MRSFYKLDALFVLRKAIIKRYGDCQLSLEEKMVYDAVLRDVEERYGSNINDSILFEAYFDDYFNDWYDNDKGYLSKEELERIDDLLIFRGLLHFKGKTISLKEFYDYTFGIHYPDKYNMDLEEDRIKLLERLNGCLGEARVAKVDTSDFEPRELLLSKNELDWLRLIPDEHRKVSLCDEIRVSVSTKDNPMIFIAGLEPSKIKEFRVEDNKRFTFISISDLHLGTKLVNNFGLLDEGTFKERLEYFVAFKNQIIQDLRDNNIKVDGIVLVGDILHSLCGEYNKDLVDLEVNLNNSRNSIFRIIRDFNIENSNSLKISSDCGMIGFISGNHDNTLGRDLFIKIMQEFGDDVVFLGDGSGRIKINDEYVLFSHPNSLDWGLPTRNDAYQTRRALNKDMFHFDDYFKLCERKYELLKELDLLDDLGMTPLSQVAGLVDLVNEDLKNNNPELFKFYEPFITRGNGDGTLTRRSCFEEAIRIVQDAEDPSIQILSKKYNNGFDISRFIDYGKNNLNIRQMLEERNVCLVGDYLDPTLSIIGHFHTRPSNGKRVAYAKEDTVSGSDGNIPVVIEEGSSFLSRTSDDIGYSATICCLDIKDGVIERIEIEPAIYIVKKDTTYQATRVSTTTSSVYVRKKTL